MQAFIGVDEGNYDVKTSSTVLEAGYTSSSNLPPVVEEYLFYNGTYYVPSKQRFNYQEDKTINERGIILTLFGIAKELKARADKRGIDVQSYVSSIEHIALGSGLPPQDMMANNTVKRKIDYYEKYMKNGIEFEYSGIHYAFDMNFCRIYPQDYAAIVVSGNDEVVRKYSDFVAVDIGGGTVDIIPFIDRIPNTAGCISLPIGNIWMYKQISFDAKNSFGTHLKDKTIENVLSKEATVLDEKVVNMIFASTQKWVDEQIINGLIQSGINFAEIPTVFLGGGSKLLRPFILKNTQIKNEHFLKDPVRANAKGYTAMVKEEFNAKFKG